MAFLTNPFEGKEEGKEKDSWVTKSYQKALRHRFKKKLRKSVTM
jgi:hypothetical protein